jgi:hypothetical protein
VQKEFLTMAEHEHMKELLLKGVEYGTQTVETLAQRKQKLEAMYADDPDGLQATKTYAATCEVLTILQQSQQ